MTDLKLLYFSGILIPFTYMFLYFLGGALRSDYSHISNSVSELLSPNAPNKRLLMSIQIVYAALHVIFGFSVLWFIKEWEDPNISGQIGAWLIVALGVTTFGTVIFPQDEAGTPQTRAGQLHKILVFGGLVPFSIFSTLFIGLWAGQTGFSPGFDVYSFITVGITVVMGVAGGLTVETRYAGLVERIAAIATQQWLFILGLKLFLF